MADRDPDDFDNDLEIMEKGLKPRGNNHIENDTEEIDLCDIIAMNSKKDLPAAPKQEPSRVAAFTEERGAKIALSDRMLLRTLMDNLSDYVYFKDRDSRFIMVNRACAEKVFSLSDGEKTVGRTDFDFFPRDYAAQSFEAEKKIISTGKPEIGKEIKVTRPNNQVTWFLNSTFPLRDERGNIIGTWRISRDITAQKLAEEELKTSEEMLRQSQKMEAFGQVAGGMAHDFNNMLSVILGSAQLLELTFVGDNADIKNNIAMVIDTSKKAAELTQQLLTFARKGSSKVLELEVHDVIHSVVGLLQHTIDKRIHIVERLNAPRSSIKGDYIQLQNALLNLGLNARDAMPDGGTLTFSTDVIGPSSVPSDDDSAMNPATQQAMYLRVRVSDTGIGMDEKTKHRVFEPFFTTKDPGKGTGLGLASVYGTVKSHNGLIEFESELNKGTKFNLYLPLIIKPYEPPAGEPKEAEKGSRRVLFIDDEEDIRFVVVEMLKSLGYSPVAKRNGVEAVDYYRGHYEEIDAIVVDLFMPGMSGNECIKALKQINPLARIIISSGYNLVSDTHQIISKGIAGFIQKPFEVKELSRVLSDALVKSQTTA